MSTTSPEPKRHHGFCFRAAASSQKNAPSHLETGAGAAWHGTWTTSGEEIAPLSFRPKNWVAD